MGVDSESIKDTVKLLKNFSDKILQECLGGAYEEDDQYVLAIKRNLKPLLRPEFASLVERAVQQHLNNTW